MESSILSARTNTVGTAARRDGRPRQQIGWRLRWGVLQSSYVHPTEFVILATSVAED